MHKRNRKSCATETGCDAQPETEVMRNRFRLPMTSRSGFGIGCSLLTVPVAQIFPVSVAELIPAAVSQLLLVPGA